jgi:acetyltransferase-like isoleucine patch superfamily enzyme
MNKSIELKGNVKLNSNTKFEMYSKIHNNCDIINTEIGMGTYIGWDANFSNCRIGRFCSIGPFSEVIYGKHPVKKYVSTHPAFFSTRKQSGITFVKKDIFDEYTYADPECKKSVVIGNDVWVGYGVKILEGVTIGDGAVIGAGAIVTKDVEPYSINVGIPSKVVNYRFSEEQINFLLNFKWWNKDFEWLIENSKYFNDINNFYDKYKEIV